MPVLDENLLIPTQTHAPTVALEPAHNAVHSLLLLTKADHLSGLGDWVYETVSALSPEEQQRHRLVILGFFFLLQSRRSWSSFPAFVAHLEESRPADLRDRLLDGYAEMPCHKPTGLSGKLSAAERENVLAAPANYLAFLRQRFEEKHIDVALETEAYHLLQQPEAMQRLIVSHLRQMWDRYLEPEWRRVEPMLQEAVVAFGEINLSEMSWLEAAEFVTGRSLEDEQWAQKLEVAEGLILAPSAHVGPYLGTFQQGDTLGILFNARLPAGSLVQAPALSRADLVVRLSALADDTRLQILRLVAEEGELRSQDVMERLDLSQSAASRHLKQLSATGYLSERRCNGAKCYRLNSTRLQESVQALLAYLSI